jgi:flagellin
MNKLSSGRSINSAADNPAGLVISEKMNAKLAGLSSAISGNEITANMLGTAESAMSSMQNLLIKARELIIDSSNTGVNDSDMQAANQRQFDEIVSSINRIADQASFGEKKLLDGSLTVTPFTSGDGDTASYDVEAVDAASLGTEAGGATYSSLEDIAGAAGPLATGDSAGLAEALQVVDSAISQLASQRGELGAVEANFVRPSIESFQSAYQELQASESTIADADIAREKSNETRDNIRTQFQMALLSQGQQNSKIMLQLLQ